MLNGNIMIFAGLCLDKYRYITAVNLQRFIKEREEVGRYLPIEDLEETLDYMRFAKWIDIDPKEKECTKYIRHEEK